MSIQINKYIQNQSKDKTLSHKCIQIIQYFSMFLGRYGEQNRNFDTKVQLRKRNQNAFIQNYTAQYHYGNCSKYITLTEQKIQADIFYSDDHYSMEENKIVKSYILDQDLAIVWEGENMRNFGKELKQKQQKLLQQFNQRENENFVDKNYQLSFLKGIYELPKPKLAGIKYKKYPQYNDFIIGRSSFVRETQSHKICSDLISKNHCEIKHFKSHCLKVAKYFKTLQNILIKKTNINSKIRKVPSDILDTIFEYIAPKQKYIITDLGSRNGTWMCQIGNQVHKLKQGFEYQFQKQSYSIHIIKMLNSKQQQYESISQHNIRAYTIIQEFKKQVNWNYYQRANKIMLLQLQDADNLNLNKKQDSKIQVLIFKIKYRDYHEFYLLAVNQNSTNKHNIGCKYDIDINPQEYDTPSLHGKIYIEHGKWMIESFQIKRNGEYRKIWTRIAKDYKYCLNTQKNYKIRLGISYPLSLQFNNFVKKKQQSEL